MTNIANSRRTLLAVAVGLFTAASISTLINSFGFEASQIIANGAFVAVGALIVLRRPGNIIGVLLVAIGVAWQVLLAVDIQAVALADAGNIEAASWVAVMIGLLANWAFWLTFPMLLLFPDGHPQSKPARRLLMISAVWALSASVVAVLARPGVDTADRPFQHPFIGDDAANLLAGLRDAMFLVEIALLLVAAGFLIVRMRRSEPVERRQIEWLAYGAAAYFVILAVNEGLQPLESDGARLLVDALGVVLIPAAIGVAILRYRLYDIDAIVNRSLTYGALAIFIGGVYITIVVGVGELLGGDAGFGLSILASVLVAMAFQPMRRRVERWANRLVYGERATPYEVLVQFSRRAAELSDDELLHRIPRLIVDGTGASEAALWVRSGDGYHMASSFPETAADRHLDGTDGFRDPGADYSLSVIHDSEMLGGLSLVNAYGEMITPSEEALLADLASGLGLALRNARLTAQLREQVAELEASRERILAAADAARRALENDLDSGPQQTLVAVKVKLGPTRKRAEQLGAAKVATMLAQLEIQSGEAIKSVRDFAGGIYPPLLEAEGLAVAIAQQSRTSAIPVAVNGDGARRYPREVEAAVYFSVLEALQNSAKYSQACSAAVTLVATDTSLEFEVRDDGRGFDTASVGHGAGLGGMADRLDTVGGELRVRSTPGQGTRVAGSVPIPQLVDA